jgi:taurine dioxygenase
MIMGSNSLDIEPTTGGVGAFIKGIDLGLDQPDDVIETLQKALGDHGVIFFRDQDITPAQHVAFAERFGQIDVNKFLDQVPGFPMIALVQKKAGQSYNIGGDWHTDHSYDVAPALGSILIARQVPPKGGDTLFANMYSALDTLSDGMKATLEGLSTVHGTSHVFGVNGRTPRLYALDEDPRAIPREDFVIQEAIHKAVIRHPISGRKALYVDPGYTQRVDGWSDEESSPFLKVLYDHATRPEHTYRFEWKPGSIAFWDNRCTLHYAVNDYQESERVMHRVTVKGVPLAA